MLKYLYSIYDQKAKIFNPPSPFLTNDEALRWFGLLVNDKQKQTIFQVAPFDFEMFCIGSFNDSDGLIISLDRQELVCRGADVYVSDIKN